MTFWKQQDAPQIIRDRLRKAFRDDGERIRGSLPDKWTPAQGPTITVAADGPQRSAKGTDRELVRVTVRYLDPHTARKIMTDIDGFLTTPGIQLLGVSIIRNRGTGLISGPDSLVGGYFASATYSVGTTRKVKTNGT